MEPTINPFDENEPITGDVIDESEDIAEIDVETADAAAVDERPRGRGRHGKRGGRPFGPNRPYRFALFVEEDGTYVLRSPDLAERAARIESLDGLGAAMQSAIDERATEDAAAAAEAEKDAQFSGKFVLRLPRSMHRQLTELAETEGVSLNQLALGFLAEGMGRAEMTQEFGERRGKHRGPRGGRGPGGCGPERRGPEGFGPRGGRGPEGRDFEGRGPQGCGPWGRGSKGHGPRRHWFAGKIAGGNAAPNSSEQNDTSFV